MIALRSWRDRSSPPFKLIAVKSDRFDRLESALGRLAELSFNNAARHDRGIDQLPEATSRNS